MVVIGILLFLLGTICGSFLNVVTTRYHEQRWIVSPAHIGGRSRCPNCRGTLRWYDLIPIVSFFWLRRRCRWCGQPISWQYPIVEALTGVAFLLPLFFYSSFHVAYHLTVGNLVVWYFWIAGAWLIAAASMITLAVIDWRTYTIPDETVAGIAGMGLLVAALEQYYRDLIGWQVSFLDHYALVVELPVGPFLNHIIAGIIGFAFFGAIYMLTRGRGLGFGDVKLAGALGLLLGWPDAALAYGLAFVIGSIISLIMLGLGRQRFHQPIPFGPYLVVSVAVVVVAGRFLAAWYFQLFGIF